MYETASKFLFDHNSQSNLKFEEPLSCSPFNTRFGLNNFELFVNRFNHSNGEENSIFNKSMNTNRFFGNLSTEKASVPKADDKSLPFTIIKDSPVTINSGKGTPTIETKHLALHTTESSTAGRNKIRKNESEFLAEDKVKQSSILKHPIAKLRQTTHHNANKKDTQSDSIYLRLYPADLETKSLMMKLDNFPRLEIKTSKKYNLKRVVDHLRKKWLSKLNTKGACPLNVFIKPDPAVWLKHLDIINSKLEHLDDGNQQPLIESYMLSDVWSGYNEPESHQLDLFYEIKEATQPEEGKKSAIRRSMTFGNEPEATKPSFFQALEGLQPRKTVELKKNNEVAESNKDTRLVVEDDAHEKSDPYSKRDYFDALRRTSGMSRNSEKSEGDVKSNVSSRFSFNDKEKMNNQLSGGVNDQSIKMLYNHLNQQFPDESKFTSQLVQAGQTLSIGGGVKHIPVKRKV